MNNRECERLRPRVEVFSGLRMDRKRIDRRYYCVFCGSPEQFTSFQRWQTHSFTHVCQYCLYCFIDMGEHVSTCPKRLEQLDELAGGQAPVINAPLLPETMETGQFQIEHAVHYGTMVQFGYNFVSKIQSFEEAMSLCYYDLKNILSQLISHWKGVRAEVTFDVILEGVDASDKRPVSLFSPFQIYVHDGFILSRLKIALAFLSTSLAIYAENSSGWRLSLIKKITMKAGQYTPIAPRGHIPNPPGVSTRFTINIDCEDSCFIASVIAILKRDALVRRICGKPECDLTEYEKRKFRRERSKFRPYYMDLIQDILASGEWNLDGFLGAVTLEDLPRFTALNNVSFMVLGYDGGYYPIYPCPEKLESHVDLVLLRQALEGQDLACLNGQDIKYKYHFIASTDTCSLIQRPGFSRDTLCTYCLISHNNLAEHQQTCGIIHKQKIRFPRHERWKSFQLYSKLDIVYKIYFTFNCYKDSLQGNGGANEKESRWQSDEDPLLKYSTLEANLIMHSYALVVVDCKDKLIEYHYYDGELPAENFFSTIIEMGERFSISVKENALPLVVTTQARMDYLEAKKCELCLNPFGTDRIKVMHHSHSDDRKGISILCDHCNLQLRIRSHVFIGCQNSEFENIIMLQALKPEIVSNVSIVAHSQQKIMVLKISKNK